MNPEIIKRLQIPSDHLQAVNAVLLDSDTRVIDEMLAVIDRYGTPEEINAKAEQARQLPCLLERVREVRPDYYADLEWLMAQRDAGAFISVADYRRKVLGAKADTIAFKDASAVTLELSSVHYFPWLIGMARQAIERGEIMPGRIIRVRIMKEQEQDGDLLACQAAMQIMGVSCVEQLDTRGADGSNIHLGGADTLVGYYGGVGMPNDYPLRWLEEFLYYYTEFGVRQVLNLNSGTILMGYFLHRLGIDIEFKISVTLGNDNPFSALWTLLTAKLFARDDGSTSLVGFNWSNSVNNETIEQAAQLRLKLGLEDKVRFEYHVNEPWKGVVIQPFLRREELLDLAERVPNISAKHEGGDPADEQGRVRPSDMFDYYRPLDEIVAAGEWDVLTEHFYDKVESLYRTARALTERGLSFVAAPNLHR